MRGHSNRMISIVVSILLLFSSTSCSGHVKSWEEQYELGIRYLNDGQYKEALLAFTAAIKIEPKRQEAFLGRGDTFAALAEDAENYFQSSSEEDIEQYYKNALLDYLEAIDLDASIAETYGKAADIYLKLNENDSAVSILNRGFESTGAQSLSDRIDQISEQDVPGIDEREFLPVRISSENEDILKGFCYYLDEYNVLSSTASLDALYITVCPIEPLYGFGKNDFSEELQPESFEFYENETPGTPDPRNLLYEEFGGDRFYYYKSYPGSSVDWYVKNVLNMSPVHPDLPINGVYYDEPTKKYYVQWGDGGSETNVNRLFDMYSDGQFLYLAYNLGFEFNYVETDDWNEKYYALLEPKQNTDGEVYWSAYYSSQEPLTDIKQYLSQIVESGIAELRRTNDVVFSFAAQ